MQITAALALTLALVSCSAIQTATNPATPAETIAESRIVIDADAAFITAARALDTVEDNHTLTPEQHTQAEALRREAYQALLVVRAAVDARRQPDMIAFGAVIGRVNAFVGSFN